MHRLDNITRTMRHGGWEDVVIDCMRTIFPRRTIISQPYRRSDVINQIRVGSSNEILLESHGPCILYLRDDLPRLNAYRNSELALTKESRLLLATS